MANLAFFKGLEIFHNLFSVWPFFSKSLFCKIHNMTLFKTVFGLFQSQAPGNPGWGQWTLSLYSNNERIRFYMYCKTDCKLCLHVIEKL